jgi:UDP-hydrolysing UDP-N-acetyl-D-glucosamine 2-epimerase
MVFNVGCPRIDLVSRILSNDAEPLDMSFLNDGVGDTIDLSKDFLVLSLHPVTTEYGNSEHQITEALKAVTKTKLPTVVLWPNSDAGSEDISRGIRKWRERGNAVNMHFFKNLPTETYIKLLNHTSCLVGNSSSGIREGSFIGTPVVNIGTRQTSRQRGANVLDVDPLESDIYSAIVAQICHGRYQRDTIYGDGHAGERIANILSELVSVAAQKRITY